MIRALLFPVWLAGHFILAAVVLLFLCTLAIPAIAWSEYTHRPVPDVIGILHGWWNGVFHV